MWIARNNILDKDLKIFTHKPTRNPDGYWEDLEVIEYDENRRYGFIIQSSDIVGDHTITWEDEPRAIIIEVPKKYERLWRRDEWYGLIN